MYLFLLAMSNHMSISVYINIPVDHVGLCLTLCLYLAVSIPKEIV